MDAFGHTCRSTVAMAAAEVGTLCRVTMIFTRSASGGTRVPIRPRSAGLVMREDIVNRRRVLTYQAVTRVVEALRGG